MTDSSATLEAHALPASDEIGLAATGELEPCIAAALSAAIEDLLVDDGAGREAARVASARLRRTGDPLGLMEGDGITNEPLDTNAPTPERVGGRGEFVHVSVTTSAGRDSKAEVWRHVPLVEAMVRRGQIDKRDAPAVTEAARRFYADFVRGHSGQRVTARYGEQSGTGGTPAGQQTVHYTTDKFGRPVEALGPDDRRHQAYASWWRACEAIGVVKCAVTGRPQPTQTLKWMLTLVCEDYTVATERTPSLEDAGRAYMGYKSPVQATAAGATLIKSGLERLVVHYGIDL